MNPRLVVAAILLTMATAGCSHASSQGSTPDSANVSPTPFVPGPTLTERSPTSVLGHLADEGNILEVGRRKVLLEARPGEGSTGDQIIEVDRSTGAQRVLVTSEFDRGEFNSAAMIGDWLVYNDKRGATTNGDVPYLWRVYALNLRTRHKLLLDGNGRKPDLTWVTIKSLSGKAVWSKGAEDPNRFAPPFEVWEPGWGKPRTVYELPKR